MVRFIWLPLTAWSEFKVTKARCFGVIHPCYDVIFCLGIPSRPMTVPVRVARRCPRAVQVMTYVKCFVAWSCSIDSQPLIWQVAEELVTWSRPPCLRFAMVSLPGHCRQDGPRCLGIGRRQLSAYSRFVCHRESVWTDRRAASEVGQVGLHAVTGLGRLSPGFRHWAAHGIAQKQNGDQTRAMSERFRCQNNAAGRRNTLWGRKRPSAQNHLRQTI